MARKTVQRGTIENSQYNIRIPLMLSPDNEFYAEWQGHTIRDKSAEVVQQGMQKYIRENVNPPWLPVILVKGPLTPEHVTIRAWDKAQGLGGCVGLTLWRGYVAETAGTALQSNWDMDEEQRLAFSTRCYGLPIPIVLPYHRTGGWTSEHYFAYTPDLWLRLKFIARELCRIETVLTELIGTDTGLQLLLAAPMQLMLAAPQEVTE